MRDEDMVSEFFVVDLFGLSRLGREGRVCVGFVQVC
jgi:hypothetical protein